VGKPTHSLIRSLRFRISACLRDTTCPKTTKNVGIGSQDCVDCHFLASEKEVKVSVLLI